MGEMILIITGLMVCIIIVSAGVAIVSAGAHQKDE